jgi:isoleucyl-tRNA synthetase
VEVLGEPVTLDDILVSRSEHDGHVIETHAGVTVSLNVELTPALVAEGQARELKNRIQTMRKEAGYNVSDRIRVGIVAPAALTAGFTSFQEYIRGETLADEIRFDTPLAGAESEKACEIDGEMVRIAISRV